MIRGEYYLHTNGSLIYKTLGVDDPDSTFIVKIWQCSQIGKTPKDFLNFLYEAFDAGATKEECERLYNLNRLDSFLPSEISGPFKTKLGIA